MNCEATRPLSRLGKVGVVLFFVLLLGFGVHVEQKSAFLSRRMGDLDVFLRAAWAVRNDADLYAITSDNDWHYLYPPLYAILMTPLADPPEGADAAGYLPYPISVAICFFISVFALLAGVHVLASALEEKAGWDHQPRYCRRWWLLRLWPILVCFLPIGHTLMRGQVNLIILAALCAAITGWLRQQPYRAGLWLALAICIKVIPAFLLVYPLWKRDGRALLGCAAGCFVGLVLVPVLTFGPNRAIAHYDTYAHAFVGPYFNMTDDDRSHEEIATTDSIGIKSALHNWMYRGPEKYTTNMHIAAKATYVLLGVAMTLVTLWPGPTFRSLPDDDASGMNTTHQLGGLILLMAILSPLCHLHYLLFCLPGVMGLLVHAWRTQSELNVPRLLVASFVLFNVAICVSHLPGLEVLKDLCIALFATVPLWVIPVVYLWRRRNASPAQPESVSAAWRQVA